MQLPLKAKRRGGNRMQADSFGQKGKVQEHAGSPIRRLARTAAILALAVAPHLAAADSGRVLRWTAVGRLFARGEAGGAGEGVDSADRQLGGSGNARLAREEAQGRVGDGRHVRTKDRRGKPRPTLAETDIAKFNAQYPSLTVRYSEKFHDRFLVLDDKELCLIGASLKDLGKKCFAFTKLDANEIAGLKARV